MSRILEPFERPNAIAAYTLRQQDSRGPEFAALRAITEPLLRARAIGRLLDTAAAAKDTDRERLTSGILDVLLELPEAAAAPILCQAIPLIVTLPPPRRAILHAKALVVAGHFGRTELVPDLLESLATSILVIPDEPDDPNDPIKPLQRVLDQSLRALRRVGLRRETAELLARVETNLGAKTEHLGARLAIAAGLAFLGDSERALPIFERARKALGGTMIMAQRLELVRALALAYAQAPLGHALGAIDELASQLRDITDVFGTNSHYCLSVLHFVESLVLGITSDDLALGEAGRRFVEDDEYLIRRRLHRDLGGTI